MDQNKLLECMEEIKSIAQSQQNQMTKEEIHQYLSDMELHEDQFDAVYQYLAMNGITISGYHPSVSFQEISSADDSINETKNATGNAPEEYTSLSGSPDDNDNTAQDQGARRRISKAERNLSFTAVKFLLSPLTAVPSLPPSGIVSLPVMLPPKRLWYTNSSIKYFRLPNPMKNVELPWTK